MRIEEISPNSKIILDLLRDLIAKGNTIPLKKNNDGWQYGGLEFTKTVDSLREVIQTELGAQGFHVVGCTVRHFARGANILNYLYPAKRILMIPLNGIATLSSIDGPLPPDTYCYLEGRPSLFGEEIDVVFVGFEVYKRIE